MEKFLIKDTDGNKSITATAFLIGFVIVNLKLILSGTLIGGVAFSEFTGVDYAASVGALGSVYLLRRSSGKVKAKGRNK